MLTFIVTLISTFELVDRLEVLDDLPPTAPAIPEVLNAIPAVEPVPSVSPPPLPKPAALAALEASSKYLVNPPLVKVDQPFQLFPPLLFLNAASILKEPFFNLEASL
jgi:hypothetical protein